MVAQTPLAQRGDAGYRRETIRRKPATRRGLFWRLALMALALLVVFGGLWGFNRMREQKMAAFFAGNKPPAVTVSVAAARSETIPRRLSGIGTVTAVRQVAVAPEIGGRVTQIAFQPGASVRAGDPLVQLNDEVEQGDLANYKAQARLAQINLTRARELAAKQVGPQAAVDTSQSQLDQAQAGIARTQALIAQKLIRAPFAGVLGIRQVELGQYVNPGAMLVTLTDLDTLFVTFTLPEQNRMALAVGQGVEIAVDAIPDRSIAATLTTIEPQISADTRTIKLQATLPNPDRQLLPGMFANAHVVLPPQKDVVTVPDTAVDHSLYGDAVYRIDAAGGTDSSALTAKRVFVRAGERFGNRTAILEGIAAGDRVVTSGQLKLRDGAAVAISETADALTPPAAVPTN